jgi:hypothetical protein
VSNVYQGLTQLRQLVSNVYQGLTPLRQPVSNVNQGPTPLKELVSNVYQGLTPLRQLVSDVYPSISVQHTVSKIEPTLDSHSLLFKTQRSPLPHSNLASIRVCDRILTERRFSCDLNPAV